MKITLYSKKGCPMCDHAKELFKRANLKYSEIKVGDDIPRPNFSEEFPHIHAFPFIKIDKMEFVGVVDVARYLLQKGYISAPKK